MITSSTPKYPRLPGAWLITGGCGFIGTRLIYHLLNQNPSTRIRVLDNLSVGTRSDLAGVCDFAEKKGTSPGDDDSQDVELIVGDIRDKETCHQVSSDMAVVVHLAASTGVAQSVENPKGDLESNVVGTFNMLEAARLNQVEKFIFSSSGAPLGEAVPPLNEETVPKPVSPYGASKLAGEAYCSAYYRTFGIKTVSLRFGNVYGPGSKHKDSVIAKFISQALHGEKLEVYGDGHQTRDFIYIDDLIEAIMCSERLDSGGEVFQIATNRETTVNEICKFIVTLVEKNTGNKTDVLHAPARVGDVKRNYSDISKAKTILNWQPRYSIEQGLVETLKYFLESE
jgi:UDP-glucose 4-epimerase